MKATRIETTEDSDTESPGPPGSPAQPIHVSAKRETAVAATSPAAPPHPPPHQDCQLTSASQSRPADTGRHTAPARHRSTPPHALIISSRAEPPRLPKQAGARATLSHAGARVHGYAGGMAGQPTQVT